MVSRKSGKEEYTAFSGKEATSIDVVAGFLDGVVNRELSELIGGPK